MRNKQLSLIALSFLFLTFSLSLFPTPVFAAFFFSTGDPTDQMATASRPSNSASGKIEIESADDFVLSSQTRIESATFTGLLVGASVSDVSQVVVEIYRVFPSDSDVGRTSGPPAFSTPQVPTRVNSPSDVTFVIRDSSASGDLSFSTNTLNSSFTANNSVLNGIHPKPSQMTGGDGPVTGLEVRFDVIFNTTIPLPAGHYFFVPQVDVTGGEFYWLSAPKPIVSPGTPFSPDLQSWIRNENLAPDWLRIGTDIVGGTTPPTFNAAFSLAGEPIAQVPTMDKWGILIMAVLLLTVGAYYFRKRKNIPAN
jgi:hypothetical protein